MMRRRISWWVAVACVAVLLAVVPRLRSAASRPLVVVSLESPFAQAGSFLFVYDPADCEIYRPVIERLEEGHSRGLDIRGIPVRKPDSRATAAAEVVARPAFPDAPHLVRPVTRALGRLGYRYTPLLLGVDRNGRLRHIIELSAASVETRRTLERLGDFLQPTGGP